MVNKLKELRSTGAEEGFTLIELMIVVVIIGILAAIAIPIFANQQKSAITAGVKSDVKNTNTNIATALVKAPTASSISGRAVGSNGAGTVAATGTPTFPSAATTPAASAIRFEIPVSDSGTTVSAFGTWNTYKVWATNSASDITNAWVYEVDGGKASDKAAPTAAPPVTP